MKKIIYLIIVMMVSLFTMGCSTATGGDTRVIKSPTNNFMNIYGTWRIESIKIFDEEINVIEDSNSIKGREIEFSKDKIDYFGTIYTDPSYKLKVVNKDYILSYESNITTEPFMNEKEKIDVISIISNNNIISEFILQEENKGYIVYMGALIEVYKVSGNSEIKTNKEVVNVEIEKKIDVIDQDYYNSEIGLMIGLKKPRVMNEDDSYTTEEYRTLWISFKDGDLMPIIEKENIIFPRLDGIWSLKSKTLENGKYHEEYFEVEPLDSKVTAFYDEKNEGNIYKNITFIGNNYIGIEKYSGEKFVDITLKGNNNKTTEKYSEESILKKYEVVPIDNINSNSGLKIEELYSKDINIKYKMEYERALEIMKLEGFNNQSNIDYSNFTVKRKDGKWELVGSLGGLYENNKEYLLNLRPNNKMLNYDSLVIPWKVLKGDIPFIRDAYISPNQRIAIILFQDNLAIYEIKDKMLKGAPLVNIDIENEQVIMAEWSTGAYVEKWSKSFSDGIYITN